MRTLWVPISKLPDNFNHCSRGLTTSLRYPRFSCYQLTLLLSSFAYFSHLYIRLMAGL